MPTVISKHARRSWLVAGVAALTLGATSAHAGQALISDHQELYPRAVLIAHSATHNGDIVASASSFDGGGHQDIFVSRDSGRTFSLMGAVTDAAFTKGLCCGGLYELPSAVGALPAGTLLWAGSVGGDTSSAPMEIRIYASRDEGATWSYLSNCATGTVPRSGGGLWEPNFAIAGNGDLVCYYSDETRAGHSQILTEVTSHDGVTWSAPVDVVSSPTQADRPGMASVVKLASGSYLMSFEMCGPLNCAAFTKTSPDGVNWSPTDGHGTAIALADGTTFWHTPTLTLANGQLLATGQILTKNGTPVTGNGGTLFINRAGDGTGGWTSLPSPVAITMPSGTAGNYCQNYSSPLLALPDGRHVLQLASDFSGTVCKTWFNVAPLNGVTVSGNDVSVNTGASASGTFTIGATGGFGDTFNLSVSAPGLPADVSLSASSLTLGVGASSDVQVTVKPTATAMNGVGGLFGGTIAMAGLVFCAGPRRRKLAIAAAAAVTTLSGCGGGGGGSGGGSVSTPTPVTTSYKATLTAVSTSDPQVTASRDFTVRITRPG
ncbi:hypothetical protein [Asticcacaulis solisilvae]|uniref:hypothetical protein n=1 Tax=Asticcacaulis solisilvae TaxID=1217274 RepID=UPI003FD6F676